MNDEKLKQMVEVHEQALKLQTKINDGFVDLLKYLTVRIERLEKKLEEKSDE
jgi:hypothetical protein